MKLLLNTAWITFLLCVLPACSHFPGLKPSAAEPSAASPDHGKNAPDANLPGLPVGSPITDFGLRSIDPATATLKDTVWLSDFVGREGAKNAKHLLLLNFYATWCKPCLAEFPLLEKMHNQYSARGLQVLSVNFRAEGEDVEDALKKSATLIQTSNLTYPVLFDRFTNRNQLVYMGSRAILPCNILIGADGVILARLQGEEASPQALEQAILKHLEGGKYP